MTTTARVMMSVMVVAALRSTAAVAQEDGRDAATALVAEGDAAAEARNYPLALQRYQTAFRIFRSPKLRFNIAIALAALGRDLEAIEEFERFLADAPDAPAEHRDHARSRIAELERGIAKLQIGGDVTGAEVFIDDKPAAAVDRPIRVTPGAHAVTARRTGNRLFARSLTVAPGTVERVDIVFAPPRQTRRWTWIAASTSAALLITGGAFGLHARSLHERYETTTSRAEYFELRDRVPTEAMTANLLFAGAGGFAITAAVLYYWEGRETTAAGSRIYVAAQPTGGVAGVVLTR